MWQFKRTIKEPFASIINSLKADPASWEYDRTGYEYVNEKAGVSIWMANRPYADMSVRKACSDGAEIKPPRWVASIMRDAVGVAMSVKIKSSGELK